MNLPKSIFDFTVQLNQNPVRFIRAGFFRFDCFYVIEFKTEIEKTVVNFPLKFF
jgi:hypothetical protein